ncbi:MAG: acylphosphatase [Pseudomonadota bacterium]
MSVQRQVHLSITGRVQGVWYRGWTVKTASALGLQGWVRNRRDGTVEAVFSGSTAAVEEMIQACRKGPPAARVDEIDVSESGEPLLHSGFRQLETI